MSDPRADPEESGPFSSERGSMLASLGARRRWFGLFGGNGTNGTTKASASTTPPRSPRSPSSRTACSGTWPAMRRRGSSSSRSPESEKPVRRAQHARGPGQPCAGEGPSAEPEPEEPLVAHSMLGDLATHAPARVEPEPPAPTRSLRFLGGPGPIPAPKPTAEQPAPLVFGHTGLHSTVGELAGLEEHTGTPFPIERFILHLAHRPRPSRHPADRGSHEDPGELQGRPVRGPRAAAQGQQPDPGDLHRRDGPAPRESQEIPALRRGPPRRRRRSLEAQGRDSVFSAASGIAGLAPGPRGPRAPRVPGSVQPGRPGASAPSEAERRAEAAPSTDQKPSEFPNQSKPLAAGPRQTKPLTDLDAAIREAARGAVGGGEGGSPVGDPEGGFVDSGPISFDTTWYDWGPYAAEMVRRIKLHWDVPELARLGWKGSLTVRFFILADGTVADAKILRQSGIPPFDFAAFQAIVKSSPFRPLPADLHSTREGVTVTFFYNMRPEAGERGGEVNEPDRIRARARDGRDRRGGGLLAQPVAGVPRDRPLLDGQGYRVVPVNPESPRASWGRPAIPRSPRFRRASAWTSWTSSAARRPWRPSPRRRSRGGSRSSSCSWGFVDPASAGAPRGGGHRRGHGPLHPRGARAGSGSPRNRGIRNPRTAFPEWSRSRDPAIEEKDDSLWRERPNAPYPSRR